MDKTRIDRIRQAMRGGGLDALVLRLPENIVMSCGVWPMNGYSVAVVTVADGPAALIAPSCEDEEMEGCWAADVRFFDWPRLGMEDPQEAMRRMLADVARRCRLGRAAIGYEGSFECVAPSHNAGESRVPCESSNTWLKSIFPSARWCDATALLHRLRAIKTEAEIKRLRIAQRVAGFGIERFHEAVEAGVSEAELAGMVYAECLGQGVRRPGVRHVNVFPQISSGPNSTRAWRPIVTTGRRKLRRGEMAVLELAVCVDGFWADVTRVKAVGAPSQLQRDVFAAVEAARQAAVRAIAPGVPACQPHEAAAEVLVEAGFAREMVHITGHGLGFRYHEPEPLLMPGNGQELEVGHVCSVEPGLYGRAFGGIRLEDNVAVTAKGAENLTLAPKVL